MDFPRLFIADERRRDVIPLGIVLASTIKSLGVPIRLFAGGIDDRYQRMLSLGCGQEVFSVDPLQFRSDSDLRYFFSSMAREDALNIVLSPLGAAVTEVRFDMDPYTVDLARILGCGVITLLHANPSASITARVMAGIWKNLAREGIDLYGTVYASVLNPREYQLLEIELGRSIPSMAMGYIPRYMERRMISMEDLCSDSRSAHSIGTMASQLGSMTGQIDWAALFSFGEHRMSMDVPIKKIIPMADSPKLAVMIDDALSFSVDNDMALFRAIGCHIEKISLKDDSLPADAKVIYFPHGIGHLALKHLMKNGPLFDRVKVLHLRGRPTLINGGFSAVWGKWFSMPGENADRLPGLGAFDDGVCVEPGFTGMGMAVDMEPVAGAHSVLPTEEGDRIKGYLSSYMRRSLGIPGKGQCGWMLRDAESKKMLGEAIWRTGKTVGSQARIELWSCPDLIKRWIKQEVK